MSKHPETLHLRLIIWILGIHLLFGAAFFSFAVWVGALPPTSALIIASLIFLFTALSSLLATAIIVRTGGNGPLVGIGVASRRAGYINGAFAGFIVGYHHWGNAGALGLGVAFFLAGRLGGSHIGHFLSARLERSLAPRVWPLPNNSMEPPPLRCGDLRPIPASPG